MKKVIKDKIQFFYNAPRTYADVRDTFNWLALRNKEIAEEFRVKFEYVEQGFIRKAKKEHQKSLKSIEKLKEGETWTATASYVGEKNVIQKQLWWKRFFN